MSDLGTHDCGKDNTFVHIINIKSYKFQDANLVDLIVFIGVNK